MAPRLYLGRGSSSRFNDNTGGAAAAGTSTSTAMRGYYDPVPSFDAALQQVLKDPVHNWKQAPDRYQTDKKFVLEVIEKASKLPPKSDLERLFPQSLRFDRDIVLAFCRRDDFEEIYHDRHLFVPGCLTNDKEVMMAYCAKIPRQLQECSETLIDDRDVVLTAVRRCGLELQYASHRLQQDEAVIRLACAYDGRALDFCPLGSVTRDKLLSDRAFLMMVLRTHGADMLRLVPPDSELRRDRELLLTAVEHGLHFRYCPLEMKSDDDFCKAALARKAAVYMELPRSTAQREDMAEAAVVSASSDSTVIAKAVSACPEILRHRTVAVAVVDRAELAFMKNYLTEQHPVFLSDKPIMLRALERDDKLFGECRGGLKEDVDVVMAALNENSAVTVLRSVTATWIARYPQAAVKAVSVTIQRSLATLRPMIPDDLWSTHRELMLAWVRRGGRVLPQFEAVAQTDRDMALTIAEHSPNEFYRVGAPLRSNLEFMEQAVDQSNGRVHRFCVGDALRQNRELAVRAVALYAHALQRGGAIARPDLQQFVQSQLDLREVFVRDFLRGITVSRHRSRVPPVLRSALPLLDRGVETGTALKQLIAEFLGIPTGEKLTMYRKCLEHLRNPPPVDPEDRMADFGMGMMDPMLPRRVMMGRMRRPAGRGGVGRPLLFDFAADDDDDEDDVDPHPIALPGIFGAMRGARLRAPPAAAALADDDDDDDVVGPQPPPARLFGAMRGARLRAPEAAAVNNAAAALGAVVDNNNNPADAVAAAMAAMAADHAEDMAHMAAARNEVMAAQNRVLAARNEMAAAMDLLGPARNNAAPAAAAAANDNNAAAAAPARRRRYVAPMARRPHREPQRLAPPVPPRPDAAAAQEEDDDAAADWGVLFGMEEDAMDDLLMNWDI